VSEIVVNVTDPGSYAVSVEGATPTTATVSNGGSVAVTVPDVTIGDVTGLAGELAAKADAVHDHVMADITDLVFPVTSVNGLTGAVVIEAGVGGGASLSDDLPQPLGTAAAGTSVAASRADHVHVLPTASVIGALDEDSTIDGGEYVGIVVGPTPPVITITQQPEDVTATQSGFSSTGFSLPTGRWSGVTKAGDKWFAMPSNADQGGDYIATSNDGITWTKTVAAMPEAATWQKPIFYDGVWLTRNQNAYGFGQCARSTDGLSWALVNVPNFLPRAIHVLDGVGFVAIGGNLNAAYSADGETWTTADYPLDTSQGSPGIAATTISATASDGDRVVVVAYSPYSESALSSIVVGTANGSSISWTRQPLTQLDAAYPTAISLAFPHACIYNTDGDVGSSIFTQDLGAESISWSLRIISSAVPKKFVRSDYGWVAAADAIYTLADNSTGFVLRDNSQASSWSSIAASGPHVVALSTDGAAAYSADGGLTWQPVVITAGPSESLVHLTNAGDLILAETNMDDSTEGGAIISVAGSLVALFSVQASASPAAPLAYAWQKSDDNGATWEAVVGATSSTLSLSGLTNAADDADQYRVVVFAYQADPVTSNAATLTVT
jgi:hypothetical protein